MSDTIRSYSGSKAALGVGGPAQRRGRVPFVTSGIAITVLVWVGWTTRDAYDIEAFLPADKPLQVRMEQAIASRETLGRSPVWAILPENLVDPSLRDKFTAPLPIPEWLAKNLFNRELYWLAESSTGEGVFVSRMTRVGTAAARLAAFLPAVDEDWAGGLELRILSDPGVYFAVRGRILIASDSRRALIEALTLSQAEHAVLDGFLATPPKLARLSGIAVLDPHDASRYGVDRIEFGVIADDLRVALVARASISNTNSSASSILAKCRPQILHAPYDAAAALVVNADTPVRDLTIALGQALGTNWPDAEQWDAWCVPPENDLSRPALPALLAQLGPEIHLTLHSIDPNEVLPVPEFALAAPGTTEDTIQKLSEFPRPRSGPSLDAVRASFDVESGVLRVPAPGGDSLEPCAAVHGDRFVSSTSVNRLTALLDGAPITKTLAGANNAYLRVSPGPVIDVLESAGQVLAENHLLKNYSPESFADQVAEWRNNTESIEVIEAAMRSDGAIATLELEVRFSQ